MKISAAFRIGFLLSVHFPGVFFLACSGGKKDLSADYHYAVKDVNEINRIRLNYRLIQPSTIELEKNGEFWLLNKKYRARKDAMENILKAIEHVRLAYIPTKEGTATMLRDLASTGTKVEIFNTRGEKIKSYFLGGNTPDDRASYMILDGTSSPAVVNLDGLDGSLHPVYVMPEREWRDRSLLQFVADSLESIVVDYPGNKESSFTLRGTGENFRVFLSGAPDQGGKICRPGSVLAYTRLFQSLGAEAILDPITVPKPSTVPFATVTLELKNREPSDWQFYAISTGDTPRQKIERYHVWSSEGDLFLVQDLIFGKIFLDGSFFTGE